ADTPAPPALALLGYNPVNARTLARLAPDHVRVRMVSDDGWLVAAGGSLDLDIPATEEQGWLAAFIYRHLLAPDSTGRTSSLRYVNAFGAIDPRLQGDDLWQALSGIPATAWRATENGGVLLVAAVPLRSHDALRGALVLEQANPALPLLANRALSSLLGASLLALLVTAALLLLFGGLLSWRIRRLRNATERATRAGGRLAGPLPLIDSRDELGDLARSFGRLFDEVGSYTEYLQTLASKLSHELNTPLAIVKSSLDNLDHQGLPADAQPYLDRARDGAARLGGIVRAMSESSRVERAIASAEAEDFDLRALVAGCTEGYRALAAPREIRTDLPVLPLPFHGAPDLIAQALDKLFDNARSFSAENGWIRISLGSNESGIDLRMANSGPLLPNAMQERLFDSLVSLRERSTRGSGEAPHLGLGLHVVRLVAELHGGQASARNLDDGSGVEFSLHLAGMTRRRLA
ncbi:MAG: ATP-binding protein, partial [Dokdonella sp.]